MPAMSSLRCLNLSLKIFSFGFLLVLLSGCASNQSACLLNDNSPYSYEDVFLHTKKAFLRKTLSNGGFYRWAGDIKYVLYGVSLDRVAQDKIKLHTRQIEKYTGLNISEVLDPRDANVFLFFSDEPEKIAKSPAFVSILEFGLGFSDAEIKIESEKVSNVATLNSYYGYSRDNVAFFVQITRTPETSNIPVDVAFLHGIYAALVAHDKSDFIEPSVLNDSISKVKDEILSEYDVSVLKKIYSSPSLNIESTREASDFFEKFSCDIYTAY